jgi:hypothetical protein
MNLTHYYHKSDRAFQSRSSLSDAAALHVIANLRQSGVSIEAQVWGTIESDDRLLIGAPNLGSKCEELGTDPPRVLTIIVK